MCTQNVYTKMVAVPSDAELQADTAPQCAVRSVITAELAPNHVRILTRV